METSIKYVFNIYTTRTVYIDLVYDFSIHCCSDSCFNCSVCGTCKCGFDWLSIDIQHFSIRNKYYGHTDQKLEFRANSTTILVEIAHIDRTMINSEEHYFQNGELAFTTIRYASQISFTFTFLMKNRLQLFTKHTSFDSNLIIFA